MTVQTVSPTYVDAPAITGLRGELLDLATIHEGVAFLEPTGLMESYNCLDTGMTPVFPCPANLSAAPTQTASSTSATGGTLAAGTYRAVLTAITARGETTRSNEITQVTSGATSRIVWNWNDLPSETGYRLYVTAVGGAVGSETFLIELPAGTVTYNWLGTPAPDGVTKPPSANTAVIAATKTFGSTSWQDGFRFGAYGGAVCKGFGYVDQERLRQAFLANESVAVENALMKQRMVVNGSSWAAATDLTPAGGAVTPAVGLAILEGHASWNYAGVPTLHVPRSIGSALAQNNQIRTDGQAFFTAQGSKVASGGGYEKSNSGPAGTTPTAGEFWAYATGEVVLYRSDLIFEQQMDRSTNDQFALVERLYVGVVDCYSAAVRVKLF